MNLLPLSTQTLAWLKHAAGSGQSDAIAILHLLDRADKRDQDIAEFTDHYAKTIAAICRRLETLERGARLRYPVEDAEATESDSPTATVSGLVERVANAMGPSTQAAMEAGELPFGNAYAATREVAAWLDTRGQHGCSVLLREEIKR